MSTCKIYKSFIVIKLTLTLKCSKCSIFNSLEQLNTNGLHAATISCPRIPGEPLLQPGRVNA